MDMPLRSKSKIETGLMFVERDSDRHHVVFFLCDLQLDLASSGREHSWLPWTAEAQVTSTV
jgi:hypothetical protein